MRCAARFCVLMMLVMVLLLLMMMSIRSGLVCVDGGALLVRDGEGCAGLGSFLRWLRSRTKVYQGCAKGVKKTYYQAQ